MRALLVTSVGVTCAAALTLPLAAPALSAPAAHSASARPPSLSPESPGSGPPSARTQAAPNEANEANEANTGDEGGALEVPEAAPPRTGETRAAALAGSTQSLPLEPLAAPSDRSMGPATAGQGLDRRTARPFSLVGVVWDDAEAELHGTVQVRTRATGSTSWSDWQDVETHNAEHAADLGSAERASGAVRGATAPLWVGDSDGVEVRVRPEAADPRHPAAVPLPEGLRLELVDPGADPAPEPAPGAPVGRTVTPAAFTGNPVPPTTTAVVPEVLTAESAATSAVNADLAPLGAAEIPALTKAETVEEAAIVAAGAKPYIGPRPKIVTRKGWGADEKLRERNFAYTKSVKAAFVHHSATGNNYTCKQAPSVLRSIYRYHVKSSGWRDFGYNFAVDKCGNIYEGRAAWRREGGPRGAHAGLQHQHHGGRGARHVLLHQPARRRGDRRLQAHRLEARAVRGQPQGQGHPRLRRQRQVQQGQKGQNERHLGPSGRLRNRMSRSASLQEARQGPDQLRQTAGPLTGELPTGLLRLASHIPARPQQEAETVL